MVFGILKNICRIGPKGLIEKHMDRIFVFMLWLINKHPMHGYEIIQVLKQNSFPMATASRIYPLLMVMSLKGLITQKEKKQGKRVRKVYSLTIKGKQFLVKGKKLYFPKLVVDFLREMIGK